MNSDAVRDERGFGFGPALAVVMLTAVAIWSAVEVPRWYRLVESRFADMQHRLAPIPSGSRPSRR
jgi:hypothetical protein